MTQTIFNFAVQYRTTIWADRNDVKIAKGQIALLAVLLAANDHQGSLDDATADLSKQFDDDGKWRGQICLGLFNDGLITRAGATNSKRLSRNAGLLRRWRLLDADKARDRIESLKRWIDSIENPRPAATDAGNSQSDTNSNSQNGVNENATI